MVTLLQENPLFQGWEKGFDSLLLSFSEPKVAPFRVTAKAVLSSEMDVSWEPVEQGDMTGVLSGYEVRACGGNARS